MTAKVIAAVRGRNSIERHVVEGSRTSIDRQPDIVSGGYASSFAGRSTTNPARTRDAA